MEGEGAQSDPADQDSLLPPRKRLLAGLKRQNCDCSSPPLPFVSGELGAHLQDLLNSSNLSPEEVVEASKAAALAASRAAAAARAAATEKAIAAVKARAFARGVLELVASVARYENSKENCPKKRKVKKKHVPVEVFYKSKCLVPSSDADEELARQLHRAMNSSPRISRRLNKKAEGLGAIRKFDGGTACNGVPTSLVDEHVEPSAGHCVGKSWGRVEMCSRVECPEKIVEATEVFENHQILGKVVVHGRRGRNKQKKLPLSQCCMRAREDSREMPLLEDHPSTGEPKYDTMEELPMPTSKPSNEEQMTLEAKPVWKCKKFKVSQCHSEGKNLHSLCAIPAVTTTSALVKVD